MRIISLIFFVVFFSTNQLMTQNKISLTSSDTNNKIKILPENIYFDECTENSKNKNFTGIDTFHIKTVKKNLNFNDSINLFENIDVLVLYEKGEKIKVISYYDNGKIYREVLFRYCKKSGPDIEYYKSGRKKHFRYYRDGILEYPEIEWRDDGSIFYFIDKIGDTIISRQFYNWHITADEVLLESEIKPSGEAPFVLTKYFPCKGIYTIYKVNDGLQLYKEFYESGKKNIEGLFINSPWKQVGKWTQWHENGKKASELFFQMTEDESKANIKTGIWSYWDRKGNLIKQEIYESNVLKKTINYPKKK